MMAIVWFHTKDIFLKYSSNFHCVRDHFKHVLLLMSLVFDVEILHIQGTSKKVLKSIFFSFF